MRLGLGKFIGSSLATGALALSMAATPAAAQQNRDECRCVDSSGAAIDHCTCFRAPRVDRIVSAFGAFSQRPRLGISIDASQGPRNSALGARISDVMEDGPAEAAGLREGDVITSIDGHSLLESIGVEEEEDFDLDESLPVQRLLVLARGLEPGQEVEVVYEREGQRQTTMLEAEDLSERWGRDFTVMAPRFEADQLRDELRTLTDGFRFRTSEGANAGVFGEGGAPRVFERYVGMRDGLELVALNPGLGAYFGTDTGVLVAEVGGRSGLGLRAGDVVVRIGDRPVESPDRFRRILGSYGDEEDITFHIRRDGADMSVTGRSRY